MDAILRGLQDREVSDDGEQTLESLDLPGIATFMKDKSCKNVFVMAGAGISTSAGIPDFRSPDTGLYANLARLNLPYPEAVFDISFFRRNPKPFYVLAKELAPGKFRPTLTHSFIRLLSEKGLLHTCFTQNIDTLERRAGVPPEKIVEAHGSFAGQHCIECDEPYPADKIKEKIEAQQIPICEHDGCNGYVKPDIVFFGEALPDDFINGLRHLANADLLICMGTSLTVYPFASLKDRVPQTCPRLLLNLDHVGGWGSRPNDVACLLPCDKAVRELCRLLGWEGELDNLWAKTEISASDDEVHTEDDVLGQEAVESPAPEAGTGTSSSMKAMVDELVDNLAQAIQGIDVNEDHSSRLENDIDPSYRKSPDAQKNEGHEGSGRVSLSTGEHRPRAAGEESKDKSRTP